MLTKSLYIGIFALLLCSKSYSAYVIESEPSYDPFRDNPTRDTAYSSFSKGSQGQQYHHHRSLYHKAAYTSSSDNSETQQPYHHQSTHHHAHHSEYGSYSSRLSQNIPTSEKVIIVNPRVHAWGAYSADGKLIRAGLATAGSSWCNDLDRACRTRAGTFRIQTLGDSDCISSKFPLGEGGAPMPYCMYFNGSQALHGSHELGEANLSHGCVRISVSDARWLRFNFARVGTKVVVKSY